MRSLKAVAFREPWASRLANGTDQIAFRGSRTPHRGEILIVSDSEPGYALAIAELVDCRAITAADNAPIRRGYAWVFRNPAPIERMRLTPQHGLFNADIPDGALSEHQRAHATEPIVATSMQEVNACAAPQCPNRPDAADQPGRSGARLSVLLIDDEPRFARGVQRTLSPRYDVRVALSKREALDQIAARLPDVLLCDYRLEWQTTEDLLEYVRDNYPAVRRVLYSFSRMELWNDLVNRRLIHTAVPKTAPRAELLSAIG